jgi:HK97 family phage major capsid protein/HK97 family phage prohead protease
MGDVIEPLGISFKNPLPLLLYHDPRKPVGQVKFKKPTADGVEFEATIPEVSDAGTVRDRVEEAWQSVKAGLIAGVSIGFRSIEEAFNKETNGYRFLRTEILELSLVAIPANPDATIHTIKQLDLAASGLHLPGVSGAHPVVRATKGARTMTIAEQITSYVNTRAEKAARMSALMQKAADAGETLDAQDTEEYDTLDREVKAVDAHLVRLRALEDTTKAAAVPVSGATPTAASLSRGGSTTTTPVITVKSNVPKGTAFTRYAISILNTKSGSKTEAAEYARNRWGDQAGEVELLLKAASAAGSTTDSTWAGPLAVTQPLVSEFLELLRPATLIGKIQNFRRVPFNISVPSQTSGGTYQWVGQGAPKPVGTLAFATVTLGIAKAAGIIVLTEELVRISSPSAEETVRMDMTGGMAQYLDTQFIDPTVAASANVSPGSVTNGTSALTTAGGTPDNARTDLKALVSSFVSANLSTANAVFVMSEANAFALGSSLNALGQPLFPGIGAQGGSIFGIPVVTSQVAGTTVALIDARGILMADDGGLTIDVSREASVQMDSAPDNPPTGTTVMVSLWQSNLVGLKAERFINWKRGRTASVKYVAATYV